MSYFSPTPAWVPDRLPALLGELYRFAELPLPPLLAPIDAVLAAEPSPDEVAQRAAATAFDGAADPTGWLETAIADWQRAAAVEAIAKELTRTRSTLLGQQGGRLVIEAVTATRAVFAKVVKQIQAAAAELPVDAPMDPTAVVDTDTTKEWKQAMAALGAFARWASIFHPKTGGGVSPVVGQALVVVEPPEISTVQPIDRITRAPVGEVDPRRAEVAEFIRAADADVDTALVRVARGDWPSLSLVLAGSPRALSDRIAAVRKATATQVVDSWGRKVKVLA